MATATFAERIQDDLTVLIADATLIDLSRQRDATATQNTARTLRVAQMAAAKIESRLGAAGSYDDTDGTIGNQVFLDFGIRWALMLYSQMYSLALTDAGVVMINMLREEIEELRESLVQEADLGTGIMDNDDLNARYPHSTWETEDADT